mgnify:CR=1 FL=1
MKNQFFVVVFVLFSIYATAQTTVSGTVVDSQTGTPIPGTNVSISKSSQGTVTDFDGKFKFQTKESPPFNLTISSVGFESKNIEITQNNQTVSIVLKEGTLLDEVVVSASRTPERIFESPVTIERMGLKEIQNT